MTQCAIFLESRLKDFALFSVWIYRIVLSIPLQFIGRFVGVSLSCKYPISCSEFAVLELRRSRLPVASVKILKRLLSCGPWNMGNEKVS